MAQQAGIDLRGLKGSGPNGRIVKADVEAAVKGARPTPAPAEAPAPAPAARPSTPAPAITAPHRLVPNSTMRKVIARRLTESKQTIPHFYISIDIDIDAVVAAKADAVAGSTPSEEVYVDILRQDRDLAVLVEQGRFRKDLYYRLNVVNLRIPPYSFPNEKLLTIGADEKGVAS